MQRISVLAAVALVAAVAFVVTSAFSSMALAGGYGKAHASKDVVDVAVEAGSFQTLVTAVQAAGLEERR